MSLWQQCTIINWNLWDYGKHCRQNWTNYWTNVLKGKEWITPPEKNDPSVPASVISTREKKGLRKWTYRAGQYSKCESQLSSSCLKPNTVSLTKIQQMKQEMEDLLATPRGHPQVHPENYPDIQPAPVWTGKSCFNKKILKPMEGDQNVPPPKDIALAYWWFSTEDNWNTAFREASLPFSFLPQSQAYISHEKGALPAPGRRETSYHWR